MIKRIHIGKSRLRFISLGKYTSGTNFEFIKSSIKDRVGVIELFRPKALNALCSPLMKELNYSLTSFNENEDIRCIVLHGSEKAFAAGADIKEMKDRDFEPNYRQNFLGFWSFITQIKKPIVGAVNGYALGGGCELAMMCDILYAGENAQFGQPEIKLGTIPGAGGTQRLTKAIGKSKSMEMILAGDWNLTATEALNYGLVSKVFPSDKVVEEALKLAERISSRPKMALEMAKEAINQSYNMGLESGLLFERRLFHSTFASNDQKEGMFAFVEKRKPKF